MGYQATHRYAKIAPRKVRPLADLIRGKFADEALEILQFQPHRGARMLEKVIEEKQMANAEDLRAANLHHLIVTDARIDGGPMVVKSADRNPQKEVLGGMPEWPIESNQRREHGCRTSAGGSGALEK